MSFSFHAYEGKKMIKEEYLGINSVHVFLTLFIFTTVNGRVTVLEYKRRTLALPFTVARSV